MPSRESSSFIAQTAALEAAWCGLLRHEPPLSPLGRKDTVRFLVDATLLQIAAALEHRGTHFMAGCPAVLAGVHQMCGCGYRPVRRYFAAGEVALRRSALPPDIREAARAALRAIRHHELSALCGTCPHTHWEGCELRRAINPA